MEATAPSGGDVGAFKHGELAKEIEDKALALKAGEVTNLIHTKLGFVLLQAVDCSSMPAPRSQGRGAIGILLRDIFELCASRMDLSACSARLRAPATWSGSYGGGAPAKNSRRQTESWAVIFCAAES